MATTETISQTRGETPRVSYAQLLVYELRVRDAMSQPPITAAPTDSLRTIQKLMKAHRISGVPIVQGQSLVGMVSIEDIINALDHDHIDAPAATWMTGKVVTLRADITLVRAVAEFDRYGFGRFPVVDGEGRLVGVMTRGDITMCLMQHLEQLAEKAMDQDAARAAARAGNEIPRRVVIHAPVKAGDFESAGRLPQRLREVLRSRGVDAGITRRAAVIAYEAETNLIIHSTGGEITTAIDADTVRIEAVDGGPGIENIALALQEGWSTAGPTARALGFGAGMGLPNIRKCADKFMIQSAPGSGTRLSAEVHLQKAEVTP